MKETTAQQRFDLLKEIADAAHDTITEWLKRWRAGENGEGEEIRLRHMDDGTTVVEVDGDEVMSVRIAVDVSVAEYVDAVNKPVGFVLTRPWSRIPVGWFVRTPKGDWVEVLATHRDGCNQRVTLDVSGKQGTYPYDPDAKMSVRRGTLVDATMDAAVDALGDASPILDDSPPFDPPYVRS
jgi:hypothetical protein